MTESDFTSYSPAFLPLVLRFITHDDWNIRKISIDVVYAIVALIPDSIDPYLDEVMEVLHHSRYDKIRPVRDAAINVTQAIQELRADTVYPKQKRERQTEKLPV